MAWWDSIYRFWTNHLDYNVYFPHFKFRWFSYKQKLQAHKSVDVAAGSDSVESNILRENIYSPKNTINIDFDGEQTKNK